MGVIPTVSRDSASTAALMGLYPSAANIVFSCAYYLISYRCTVALGGSGLLGRRLSCTSECDAFSNIGLVLWLEFGAHTPPLVTHFAVFWV